MRGPDEQQAAIWAAIDEIAAQQGLSPSALARRSGHDPTAFNKSKRVIEGDARWPSTETIAKVIAVAGMTWVEFGQLVDGDG